MPTHTEGRNSLSSPTQEVTRTIMPTKARTNAQRLSAAAAIAALEAAPVLTTEVPMSTTLVPADLMAQLRDAVATVQQAKAVALATPITLAAATPAPAPAAAPAAAAVDSTDNSMGAMPRQMADKWAELRLTPEWPIIVRYNARGVPLNKFGAFIGKADKTKAGVVLDPNTTLAPARTKPAPAQTPAAPAVPTLTPELLALLRTLGVLPSIDAPALVQPAPAPVVSAPAPQPEDARISIQDFSAMYPEVMDDLKAAVLGTVFVPGGSWAAFRTAVLGR